VSTTYTANVKFAQPALGDTGWSTPLNANSTTLDGLASVGALAVTLHEVPSTSLNVTVAAGNYLQQDGTIATYGGALSQAVTTATTNYLYLDLTLSGALTVNTTGFPTTAHFRLAIVVAGVSTIASISDQRVAFSVIGPFVDGVNWTFGTTTGTQIGTATTQKIGFFGATPVVQPTMGASTAGSTYTSHEQGMLQAVYNAIRVLGLGS
jgi:hypothetical protein